MSNKVFLPLSVTKHFAAGSTCPEVKPNVLRLYSMQFCPYAQRTRLVLAAKKIPHEVVNINLVSKPEWYFQRNPLGKVPCLEFDGKLIFESLVTADYLDEVYPEPRKLNSQDPYQKAQDRIMVELFGKVLSNFYKLIRFKSSDEATIKGQLKDLQDGLKIFEDEIVKRGSTFLGGDLPGMLDYMIWPWMERLWCLPIASDGVLNIQWPDFPNLVKWSEDMKNDDSVKESYFTPEIHTKFLQSYLSGNPDYDMGLSHL